MYRSARLRLVASDGGMHFGSLRLRLAGVLAGSILGGTLGQHSNLRLNVVKRLPGIKKRRGKSGGRRAESGEPEFGMLSALCSPPSALSSPLEKRTSQYRVYACVRATCV